MLIKNDKQIDFSLSEDKKSRRQEESRKKIFRSNQGLLTKMMILTLAVVRCTSAKSINGLILKMKSGRNTPQVAMASITTRIIEKTM